EDCRRRRDAEDPVEEREIGLERRAAERLNQDDSLALTVESRRYQRLNAVRRSDGIGAVAVQSRLVVEARQFAAKARRGTGRDPLRVTGDDDARMEAGAGERGLTEGYTRDDGDGNSPDIHRCLFRVATCCAPPMKRTLFRLNCCAVQQMSCQAQPLSRL